MGYLSDNDIQGVCLDIDGTLYPRWMMDLFLALSFFPDPRLGLRYNFGEETLPQESGCRTSPYC